MSTPEINFRHDYVGGALTLKPPPGQILVCVYNHGNYEHYVRGLVYRQNGDVEFDSFHWGPETDPGQIVHAQKLWIWVIDLDEHGRSLAWVRILTTSWDLVPSVEFRIVDESGDLPQLITYAYQWPGDFARFELPFRPTGVGPGQVDPVFQGR
jgi:hypothetical protein